MAASEDQLERARHAAEQTKEPYGSMMTAKWSGEVIAAPLLDKFASGHYIAKFFSEEHIPWLSVREL